jgi:hypothetical protein
MKRSRKFEDENENKEARDKSQGKRKHSGEDFEDAFDDEYEEEDQINRGEGDWEDE